MKFTWFNLMPWPYLPDDFREKNRSVWVDIPNTLYDPKKGHFVYHQYMDQLEYAETLGFDGIGCNEHHQNGYGLMPSPNLIAAGLARRTSRAAICVIGNSIAGYNPPIRVAEEFAMLDVISGGRLVAGFPVGTPMDTNFCYGQIPALTRDKYREAHDLIMKAWAEDEPFAFDGKYNQLRWVNCWPKPIQKPHPPIYIPGGGSIETWDFCLDHDYNYSYLSFYGYLRGKSLLEGYWERVAARGKDDSPYRAAFAQIICVADTDAEAEELYAEHCLYFFNRCLHVFPPFADPPGYRTVNTIKYGALSQLRLEAQKLLQNLTWKQLVDERFIIAGSPETVRQQLEECITGLRIGHLFCLLHTGNMPDWKTRHSTKLFAEKVMRQRDARGLPARRGRPPGRQPVPRPARRALSRLRPRAARLRRVHRRGAAGGHAGLHAPRLGRGGRARPHPPPPGRPLDGRHDHGGDGRGRPSRPGPPGPRGRGGAVDRRAPHPGHLCPAARPAGRAALPGSGQEPGAAHRRGGLLGHGGVQGVLPGSAAPARDGGQDPVPDPEPPRVQAPLPGDRADPRALGRGRPADRAGLRAALGPPHLRGAGPDDPGRGPHAALRAAAGLGRRAHPISWMSGR